MKGAERDNSEDFDMHSKRAREVWRELRVGELVRCPERVWTVSIKTWVFGRAVYDYVVRSVGEFRF